MQVLIIKKIHCHYHSNYDSDYCVCSACVCVCGTKREERINKDATEAGDKTINWV